MPECKATSRSVLAAQQALGRLPKLLQFRTALPILEFEQMYRDRYAGSEADLRFDAMRENTLHVEVAIRVPHMVTVTPEIQERFALAVEGALRELSYDVAKLASKEFSKQQRERKPATTQPVNEDPQAARTRMAHGTP